MNALAKLKMRGLRKVTRSLVTPAEVDTGFQISVDETTTHNIDSFDKYQDYRAYRRFTLDAECRKTAATYWQRRRDV
jgi:hypothetical protein